MIAMTLSMRQVSYFNAWLEYLSDKNLVQANAWEYYLFDLHQGFFYF